MTTHKINFFSQPAGNFPLAAFQGEPHPDVTGVLQEYQLWPAQGPLALRQCINEAMNYVLPTSVSLLLQSIWVVTQQPCS